MHPSRPIRGPSDQRLPTRGGMRWPEVRVWRCAPGSGGPSRTVPSPRVGDTEPLGGCAVTPCQRPGAVEGSQRWVGPVRPHQRRGSENSDHRGSCGASLKHRARDAERFGGLAVRKKDGRRSLAGSPFCYGVARCRSPRVRRTPASRAPSDLTFRERNRSAHHSGAQNRAARTMEVGEFI